MIIYAFGSTQMISPRYCDLSQNYDDDRDNNMMMKTRVKIRGIRERSPQVRECTRFQDVSK